MTFESDKFVLLGSSGILGTGFNTKFDEKTILRTSRSEVESWFGETSLSNMRKYFSKLEPNTTVVNAIGLTDPKTPIDQLKTVNFIFPRRLLGVTNELGLQLVTFGTIMERHVGLASVNPYIKSKNDFFSFIQESPPSGRHLHLQLHTIYGGRNSHRHMFIDQIYYSLTKKCEFEMSSGRQIREYHHIDDEMNAISRVLQSKLFGTVELNAGNAIQIRQLATEVFKEFAQLPLLKFNAKLDGVEVFNHFYEKSPHLIDNVFRDPILGVIKYLKNRLKIYN